MASRLLSNTRQTGLNYELVKFLGKGGFGATFEALNMANGNRVAIKFIFPFGKNSVRDGVMEIENYMKVAGVATVNDMTSVTCQANLLCFHDAGELLPGTDDYKTVFDVLGRYESNLNSNVPIIYIVTSFLEGDDLSKIISKGIEISERELSRFLYEMLTALNYLHSRGLTHRDIKPENIIRTKTGKYVLIDFGLICSNSLCSAVGTLGYMTNELLLLLNTSDLDFPYSMTKAGGDFALALTFFELATSQRFTIRRLKNGVYPVSELPDLTLKSELMNDIYAQLLNNYTFISSMPDGLTKLLQLLNSQ
jgi:serine/threonine protein kinase